MGKRRGVEMRKQGLLVGTNGVRSVRPRSVCPRSVRPRSVRPAPPVTNTMGTLPAIPQISILHSGSAHLNPLANVSAYYNVVPGGSENVSVEDLNFIDSAILPGLPDDVAKYCLAFVPGLNFSTMGVVCRKWRLYMKSKELLGFRKLAKTVEEWLYGLGCSDRRIEVFDSSGQHVKIFKGMPPVHVLWYQAVHLDGKLLVMGGFDGASDVRSSDVYQYDCRLRSWSKLASMNEARSMFACAVVNGVVYVAGGLRGVGAFINEVVSSVEVYDADKNEWTIIGSLKYPRYLCIASSLNGKLYVMGGINRPCTFPNSPKFVEIYDPEKNTWHEMMPENEFRGETVHDVIEKKIYFMDELNGRRVLRIFKAGENPWELVAVPSRYRKTFKEWLAIMNGKIFVFLGDDDPMYYDPHASSGHQWQRCHIRPSLRCLSAVTVRV